ncbi:MAG: oxidoreductase [Fusobacteria bacterium]|nr:MAG: oxidoreductase [Fusobacteriota bacterium]KAF0229150.1 MAG: hypothetical protein FD182_1406 [Fusobacteriota bacterium]
MVKNLYKGNLYWDKTLLNPYEFEKVNTDLSTKVLIIGGGFSGNLCANVLSQSGMDVTVVEKSKVGTGSSVASTGLIQYRSDKMLSEFIDEIGEEKGRLFYQMCLEAVDNLTAINNNLNGDTEYRLKDSIYYASSKKDEKKLKTEFEYLKKYDFPVEYLDKIQLNDRYGIKKVAALRTWHDADVNPYKFIQVLIKRNLEQGVKYFENTNIDLDSIKDNSIKTKDGNIIKYDKIILATGYSKIYPATKKKTLYNRTYAICTKPLENLWTDEVMIWETMEPYLYIRTTEDKRIIAGGLDEERNILEKNQLRRLVKATKIADKVKKLFPNLDIKIDYYWTALFYGTKDGLPFIGKDPDRSNVYYLLGYEGNGMCYSMAGSLIIKDLINGVFNKYENIVGLDR